MSRMTLTNQENIAIVSVALTLLVAAIILSYEDGQIVFKFIEWNFDRQMNIL